MNSQPGKQNTTVLFTQKPVLDVLKLRFRMRISIIRI